MAQTYHWEDFPALDGVELRVTEVTHQVFLTAPRVTLRWVGHLLPLYRQETEATQGQEGAGCGEEAEGLGGRVPLSRGTAVSPSPCQHFPEPKAGASHAGLPQGKTMDFVDVNESNARWVQDFRLKAYASPAKLESIDGAGRGGSGWGWFQLGSWPQSARPLCSWSIQGLVPKHCGHPGPCPALRPVARVLQLGLGEGVGGHTEVVWEPREP